MQCIRLTICKYVHAQDLALGFLGGKPHIQTNNNCTPCPITNDRSMHLVTSQETTEVTSKHLTGRTSNKRPCCLEINYGLLHNSGKQMMVGTPPTQWIFGDLCPFGVCWFAVTGYLLLVQPQRLQTDEYTTDGSNYSYN